MMMYEILAVTIGVAAAFIVFIPITWIMRRMFPIKSNNSKGYSTTSGQRQKRKNDLLDKPKSDSQYIETVDGERMFIEESEL